MVEWVSTTLGELIEQGNGKIQTGPFGSQLHASDYVDAGIPCVMPTNMRDNRVDLTGIAFITNEDAQRLSQHLVQEGDIVYSRRGDVTQKALIRKGERGYFCGTGCLLVRPGSSVDPEFLTYHLSTPSNQEWIVNQAVGAHMANLNTGILSKVPLRVPDKQTQQKIAAVLSALDAKIDLNQRINAELESLAKTIYDYWFVQFDFPDAHGRPYKSSGGAMVWNDTLKREIPVGWEAQPLSAWIAKQKNGEWGTGSVNSDSDAQVTCIRGADINALNGRGELNAPTRYVPPSKVEKYLAPYDLVIEISGGSPTQSTGRAALVSPEVIERFNVPLVCSNFCKALTLNDAAQAFHFLQQWNALYSAGVFFGWEGKTSGIKNLQFDAFVSDYRAPVPPEALSQRFHALCRSLDQRKQSGLRENAEITRLRDWLLPLLMNGQVRVA